MIRIAIADDEALFRKGLILLLDDEPDFEVAFEAAKAIREQHPGIRFIVLSTYFSKAFIINMIEIGASAYLAKNATPDEMKKAIREVHEIGFCYNQKVLEVIRENMVQKIKPKISTPFGVELTEREKEILQLICEEYTTPEIADKLFLSPRTVDGHRNNLFQKLQCKNTAGLVVYAVQHGLIKVNPETFWFKK